MKEYLKRLSQRAWEILGNEKLFAAILLLNVLMHCVQGNIDAAFAWFIAMLLLYSNVVRDELEKGRDGLIEEYRKITDQQSEVLKAQHEIIEAVINSLPNKP